jgi:hypothetical protein
MRVPIGSPISPQGHVLVPSPWIAYLLLSFFFSAILLFVIVRLLRPTPEIQSRTERRQPDKEREPQKS